MLQLFRKAVNPNFGFHGALPFWGLRNVMDEKAVFSQTGQAEGRVLEVS